MTVNFLKIKIMSKSNILFEENIYSIKSKFKTKEVLGYGLNGKVILAKSKDDKQLYAIKVLLISQEKNINIFIV